MAPPRTPLAFLPEELQLLVIDILDVEPPSWSKIDQEPSLALTDSADTPLKALSCASKHFRRLVMPVLFRCSRVRLDRTPWLRPQYGLVEHEARLELYDHALHWAEVDRRTHWKDSGFAAGDAFTRSAWSADHQRRRATGVAGARSAKSVYLLYNQDSSSSNGRGLTMSVRRSGNGDDNDTPVYNGFWDTRPQQARYWLPILYSASQLFLRFVVGHEIKDCIKSLVVYTDEALETAPGAYPHYQLEVDHCWQGSAAFWHDLLSVVNPSRLTILASPVELACLVNCSISTVHEWAFSDMDFHILSLHQNTSSRSLSQLQPYNPHHAIPYSYSAVASASILHARPWHHAALNEGSFLKAYATYEYFERGPPSVIYSIKTFLHGLSHDQPNTSPILSPHHSIDSFAYTAIFPFANHITAT
ncbi:hypothetical protein LTR66_009206, partial [Elasticomyces elasticus]